MPRFILIICCLLIAAAAQAASFDGEWKVVQNCPDAKEAKGYTFQYPATVKGREIHGQFRKVGESPSATLTGTIDADGNARMNVKGLAGNPKYNLHNVKTGSPVNFDVVGKFEGSKGTGSRTSGRPCNFTFTRN